MPSLDVLPLIDTSSMPYCKGCGHDPINRAMAVAMDRVRSDPHRLCLVSDIGCVGLVDKLFPTIHTVHTTHGRSTAFATGISITDGVLHDGELKTVVVLGDGGATIGLLHLVAAAQLNVDVTVIVHNNHLYGMTGGQASGLTPDSWVTATTPVGNPLPPLDVLGVLEASGATYLARALASDRALSDVIAGAIAHPGFAVVEVMELCTAFGTKFNKINKKKLQGLADSSGKPLGVHAEEHPRPPYRTSARQLIAHYGGGAGHPVEVLPNYSGPLEHRIDRRYSIMLAGTAGERVQSAGGYATQVAVDAGLYATRKADNLVTQGTGYSVSVLTLSPDPINYTGNDVADIVVASSVDGLGWLKMHGVFDRLTPESLVVIDDSLEAPQLTAGKGQLIVLPLRRKAGAHDAAMAGLGFALERSGIMDSSFIGQAAEARFGASARRTLKALAWAKGEART